MTRKLRKCKTKRHKRKETSALTFLDSTRGYPLQKTHKTAEKNSIKSKAHTATGRKIFTAEMIRAVSFGISQIGAKGTFDTVQGVFRLPSTFDIWHSVFSIQHSAFSVRCPPFDIRHLTFDSLDSTFDIRLPLTLTTDFRGNEWFSNKTVVFDYSTWLSHFNLPYGDT